MIFSKKGGEAGPPARVAFAGNRVLPEGKMGRRGTAIPAGEFQKRMELDFDNPPRSFVACPLFDSI